MFRCQRCHATGRYPLWVTARWRNETTVHRCERCGTAHSCRFGREADAIPPMLQPICVPGRLSPWYDGRYRPYVTGVFECEFRNGLRLQLQWSGRAWMWRGLAVDVSELLKWRGTWGNNDTRGGQQ